MTVPQKKNHGTDWCSFVAHTPTSIPPNIVKHAAMGLDLAVLWENVLWVVVIILHLLDPTTALMTQHET